MSTTIPYEVDDREVRDDENEESSRFHPFEDPISIAVGAKGFSTDHVVEECVERFDGSRVSRFPERFDRFYWQPTRLLIDVLPDFDAQELAESRKAKRCAFKEDWCRAHGWLYVVVPESVSGDVVAVRALITAVASPVPAVEEVTPTAHDDAPPTPVPGKRGPGRPRGSVSRPKATT